MSIFAATERDLTQLATRQEAILVAFSGGKDSLAVLQLCSRAFRKVVCFHMEWVPGLACIEKPLEYARQRWNVEIVRYPHWDFIGAIKYGTFCTPHVATVAEWPDMGLGDIHDLGRQDTGIDIIAHGGKRSDSMWRRKQMARKRKDNANVVYPLQDWNKWDVLAYLKQNDIPIPDAPTGHHASSPGSLACMAILWMADKHPEDFQKFLQVFPFAEAVVKRRDWYGVGKEEKAFKKASRGVKTRARA